jgi:uncharacterized membrane protein YgdD (TMEM256/DUF423 family)
VEVFVAKLFVIIGAVGGFLSVALGAFGAHGLNDKITKHFMEIYQTAVQYQMYHSLALLLVGILAIQWQDSASLRWSGYLMIAGIVLFSGSLYVLSLTGIRWLGAITPLGGIAFLVAWFLLAVAAYQSL